MLGLPAFDQSAVGSELLSGPSPNTFPTLLGLGIALTFPSTTPPLQPPKKRVAVIWSCQAVREYTRRYYYALDRLA